METQEQSYSEVDPVDPKSLVEIADQQQEEEETKDDEERVEQQTSSTQKDIGKALGEIADVVNEEEETQQHERTVQVLKNATESVLREEAENYNKTTSDGLKDSAEQVLGESELVGIAKEQLNNNNEADLRYKDDVFAEDDDSDGENVGKYSKNRHRMSRLDPKSSTAWKKLYATAAENGKSLARGRKKSVSSVGSSTSRRNSIRESRERLSRSGSFCGSTTKSKTKSKSGKPSQKKVYDKEDDEKNCTFKPKINKSSQGMVRNSGPFLERFETAHESKTQALEVKRAKKHYEERVDKKVCPKCQATQSYDEFKNHKNKCRNCKVAFRYKLLWQDVGDTFLQRMEEKQSEREEKYAELEMKTAPSFRPAEKTVYDPEFGTTRKVKTVPVAWEHVERSFMRRMEMDVKKRETKRVIAERDSLLGPDCTFSPNLSTTNSLSRTSYELSLLDESFEDRMERDLARRRREQSQKELRSQYHRNLQDPAATFKSKAAWDDNLETTFTGGQRRNPSGRWI